jgi:glycosyltransferase involved in cell wall biosynthesis
MGPRTKAHRGNSRHVLVIAYAFAPASPIGTMRTLRFVKRLDAEGWSTTVVTASPHTYEPQMPMDPALLKEVPAGCELLHVPVLRPLDRLGRGGTGGGPLSDSPVEARAERPQGPFGKMRAAIGEFTRIPDRSNGWIAPAIAGGLVATLRRRPAAIYSTAPPWSGQVAALALSCLTRLPWVADFRDPWARAPWRENLPERIRNAAVALERRVVTRANAVLFATATNKNDYVATYGASFAHKFHVIPNGCDPAEFAGIGQKPPTDDFVLVHAGSLYGARTPAVLLGAIATGIRNRQIDPDRFRLRLIGSIAPNLGVPAVVDSLGLQRVVEFVPRVPRHDVIREMAAASCLLLLQPGTTVSIPGKLYEYLATGRPILALAEEGETSQIVRSSGLGIALSPHDEAGILRAIVTCIGSRNEPVRPAPVQFFDGNVAAARAVRIVQELVAPRQDPRTGADAEGERSEVLLS